MFSDILDRKGYFLDQKKMKFEKSIHKGNFRNEISPWILSKK